MRNDDLSDLNLAPHDCGWRASLPTAPRFFGHEISIDIQTQSIPSDPPTLPPISSSQAALVRKILPQLGSIMQRVESEMIRYEPGSEWRAVIRDPHIWLSNEDDDGESWTFVIESTDNPDFGWHVEFKTSEFHQIWSGD